MSATPPARAALYILSLAAIAFAVRSFFFTPPSAIVIAVFGAVYFALFFLGIFVLRLRVFVAATVRGPDSARGVALTFDDGPHPKWTRRTLDVLDAAGVKGTFFVVGKKAEAHPDVVKEIVDRGHTIGLHSYAHDRLFALRGPGTWRKDLTRCRRVVERAIGAKVYLFRPPIGHTNPHVARVIRELDLDVIGWDVSARDGISALPERVTQRILAGARHGSIVLLHDAAERDDREPAGVIALPSILEGLKARDLDVVPLERMLEDAHQ
ncbi:polysaccharide deacetylase family protein [soil metagenome]